MSEPKFTPGPWKWTQNFDPSIDVRQDGYGVIAKLYDSGSGQGKINAHLIAAAPELFEVLLEMVETIDSGDEHGSGSDWHKAAQAALAKARGDA